MSSSALESIASLLERSFAQLASDSPRHHERLAAALAPHRIELCVDGERVRVCSDSALTVSADASGPASASIMTSSATILAVLDARCTIAEAVERGELVVVAPLTELDALREALLVYVHGGVRSPAFPELVARLRTRAATLQQAGAA